MSILGSLSTKGSNRAPSPTDARRKDIAKPLLVEEEDSSSMKAVEPTSPQQSKPIRPAEDFSTKNYAQSDSPNFSGIGGDGESASSPAGSPAVTTRGGSSGEYSNQGGDGSFSEKAGAKLSAIGEEVSGAFSFLGKKVSSLGSKIKTKVNEVGNNSSSNSDSSMIPATGGNPIVSTDDVGKKDKLKETEVSLLDSEAISPADETDKDPARKSKRGGKKKGTSSSNNNKSSSSSAAYSTTNYQQCDADYGGFGGGGDVSSKDDDVQQQVSGGSSDSSPVSEKVKEKWSTLRSKVKTLIEDM